MSSVPTQAGISNGASAAHDLFALTDEQILQIEPEAQDVEVFAGERSDSMDPLREDLELLATSATQRGDAAARERGNAKTSDDGLKAVATNANATAQNSSSTGAPANTAANTSANTATATSDDAPSWLAERMNDPQHGAEARELWQGVQAARQEASAFREVFAKPEEARAAAGRARMLDEIDRAYFGAADAAPEQLSASRAQLAAMMMREDPAAFREMVFAGLRALENSGLQGSSANAPVAPPFRAASSTAHTSQSEANHAQVAPTQTQPQNESHREQDARVAAYAAFERAANEELARGVGSAIERSLQQALPNASRSENGAGLQQRLAVAVRQDVEQALQGDRALGEQVARILSGQRLDAAVRAQVVRLIGERAQQLVPGATRRVLADWTQTTLAAHGARGTPDQGPARQRGREAAPSATVGGSAASVAQKNPADAAGRSRTAPRRIDYRRISDDDILNS